MFAYRTLELPSSASKIASDNNFDLKGNIIEAELEQLRQPRKVRIGVIQNSIVLPTTDPVDDQQRAIFSRIETIISAASLCGVNIICLQEAWSKYEIKSSCLYELKCPCLTSIDCSESRYAIRILYPRKTSMD